MASSTFPAKSQAGTRSSDIESIMDSLRSLSQSLRIAGRQAEQELGISAAQLEVLRELSEQPASSINELAQRTFTHQSSVSIVVNRLVASRLVTRIPLRDDARRLSISLTSAGKALLRRAPYGVEGRLARVLTTLSPAERRSLTECLSQIAEKLSEARIQRTTKHEVGKKNGVQ